MSRQLLKKKEMMTCFKVYKRLVQGFSLIELMIVIVIVGILAAIAFPSYRNYILSSRRTDAMSALINLESSEESYRFNNQTYIDLMNPPVTAPPTTAFASTSPLGYYSLATSNISATSYMLTATATGDQTADTNCVAMSIQLSAGVEQKTSKKSSNVASSGCWTSP